MRVNMHTHTVWCDGADTPEQMIQTAIEKEFDILGFSGHGYSPYDTCGMKPEAEAAYLSELRELKKQYADQIEILIGIEQDSTCPIPSKEPFDFVIGSVHFIEQNGKYRPIDYKKEELRAIGGILECFGKASGLLPNLEKTEIFPVHCENIDISEVM